MSTCNLHLRPKYEIGIFSFWPKQLSSLCLFDICPSLYINFKLLPPTPLGQNGAKPHWYMIHGYRVFRFVQMKIWSSGERVQKEENWLNRVFSNQQINVINEIFKCCNYICCVELFSAMCIHWQSMPLYWTFITKS